MADIWAQHKELQIMDYKAIQNTWGLHSTEEAFLLPTQQPWIRIPNSAEIFSLYRSVCGQYRVWPHLMPSNVFLQIQKQWRPEISTAKSSYGYTILLVLAWPQAFSSTWISGTTLVRILLLHYSKVDCNLCSGGLLTIPWLILRTNIRADHSYNDVIDDGINLLGPLLQPTTYLPFWIFFWANIPIPSWAPI